MLCHQKHTLTWRCLDSFSDWHSSTTALTTHMFWEPLIFCFWPCSFPLFQKKIIENQSSHNHFSSWSTNSLTPNLQYIHRNLGNLYISSAAEKELGWKPHTLRGPRVNPATCTLLLAHGNMTAEPFITYWTHVHAGLLFYQWFECT